MKAAYFSSLWRTDGGASPRWTQEGLLILHPSQKIAANKLYDITIVLHNSEEGQNARHCNIHLSKLLDDLEFPVRVDDFLAEAMVSGSGRLAPLLVFDFLYDSTFIIQSSPSAGISNTITVTITPRTTLIVNDAINISNLAGVVDSSGVLQLSSTHANKFSDSCGGTGGYALWSATSDALTVCLVEALMPMTTYTFSFDITNPAAGQSSPSISIQVFSPPGGNTSNVIMSKRAFRKAEGDFAPLVIAGFSVAVMAQSTQSFSTFNNLTVTLVPFTTISGHSVTISGLKGVYRESDQVALRDASGDGSCAAAGTSASATCHTFFKSESTVQHWPNKVGYAQWVGTSLSDLDSDSSSIVAGNAYPNIQIGGEVRMSTARFIPAGQVIQIVFDVMNAAFGQAPPAISIQYSNASVSSSVVQMTSVWNSARDALRIAGFDYTYGKQSEAASYVINSITFFFQNYAVLRQDLGTKLTISGLVNTKETQEASNSRILREVPTFSGSLVGVSSYYGPFVIDTDISFTAVGYLFKVRSEARLITSWDVATKTVHVASSYSFTPVVGEQYSITRGFHDAFGYVGAWNITTGTLILSVQGDSVSEKIYGFSFEVLVRIPDIHTRCQQVHVSL